MSWIAEELEQEKVIKVQAFPEDKAHISSKPTSTSSVNFSTQQCDLV